MKFVTALECKHTHCTVRLSWTVTKPTPDATSFLRVKDSENCNFAGSNGCPVVGPDGERNFSNCPYLPSGTSG
jgi:hypothetical protein